MQVAYEKGLHELGDGLFAYLQPDGGWGWSNAGLITADGASLLVDTLYDLRLTREMLDSMAPMLERDPLEAALDTYANPDHCFGNELLPTATEIYASAAVRGRDLGDLAGDAPRVSRPPACRRRSPISCATRSGRSSSRGSRFVRRPGRSRAAST